jgi:hypothetical protein
MAKKPEQDRALIIVGIVGAAAVVGGALYFAFTSQSKTASASQANPTPTPPDAASATGPTIITPGAPPATTFELQLTTPGDQNIALKVGETIKFDLPPVPAGADMWGFVDEAHDGAVTSIGPGSFQAVTPGVVVLRFFPANRLGGGVGPGFNVAVTIT